MSVERSPFPDGAAHAPLLRMLLALDGSTTRICEALAQQPIEVQLHQQITTESVPLAVRQHLGGHAWLLRATSLISHGRVMMDNLSYTRLDAVPDDFLQGLHGGVAPIGHLLQNLFVRREPLPHQATLSQALWSHVGHPHEGASRSYVITTAAGPLMLICEAFRAGMVVAQ